MDSNSVIQTKMFKLDNSLEDLKKEISKCTKNLEKLQSGAELIIEKLNEISQPASYLNEFMGVHKFMMKYIGFLTEVNCRFEVMEILDLDSESVQTIQNHLTTFYKAFEKNNEPKLSIAVGESFEFLEDIEGSTPNTSNEEKGQPEAESLEGNKGTPNILKEGHSGAPNILKEGHSGAPNILKEGHSGTLNILKEGHSGTLNILKEGHSGAPNILKEGHSGAPNILKEGHSGTLNILKEGKGEPEAESLEGKIGLKNLEITVESKKLEVVEEESYYLEVRKPELPEETDNGYDVYVTHVISPSEFYVQITETRTNVWPKLEKALKAIDLKYRVKKEKTTKRVAAARALMSGKKVFGLYYSEEDQMWFRVTVSDWILNRDTEMLTVFFLDHGEYKEINFEHLLPMRTSFTKYAALAHRCHLTGIRPIYEDMERDLHWGDLSTTEMVRLLADVGNIEIYVVPEQDLHHSIPESSLPVRMWTITGKKFNCINKIMIQKRLAVEWKLRKDGTYGNALEEEAENVMETSTIEEDEDFESYDDNHAIEEYETGAGDVNPDMEILSVKSEQSCMKGRKCRKEHSVYDPFGCSKKTENVYRSAFNDLTPPPIDSIRSLIVTSVTKVHKFYGITPKKEEEDSLTELVQSINDLTDEDEELKKLILPPAIGQIVLAKYSSDKLWYRAKVLDSFPESDEFLVMFVDYGNEEIVPISRLREIEARFLHLPFQAMQCFVFGVSENPKAPQDEVAKFLKSKLHDQEVKVEVVSHFPGSEVTLLVRLYDLYGNNIGHEIIRRGYGVHKDDIILDPQGYGLPG